MWSPCSFSLSCVILVVFGKGKDPFVHVMIILMGVSIVGVVSMIHVILRGVPAKVGVVCDSSRDTEGGGTMRDKNNNYINAYILPC